MTDLQSAREARLAQSADRAAARRFLRCRASVLASSAHLHRHLDEAGRDPIADALERALVHAFGRLHAAEADVRRALRERGEPIPVPGGELRLDEAGEVRHRPTPFAA